jgi:hypothetical protein
MGLVGVQWLLFWFCRLLGVSNEIVDNHLTVSFLWMMMMMLRHVVLMGIDFF